eukprot:CAMPEP_0197863844 /NCGR_PEP_ID=MMETSP1438-20131217/41609_1 /TAXON_ID=1461541 /ORGANISM="Pterosperma sp., Strain CCMP1384" /LENGTH=203 /DNA_ID=CAMNT_0043481883 /DNA_START=41 /DNA_END=653 /DNA_ORIENTATION=-
MVFAKTTKSAIGHFEALQAAGVPVGSYYSGMNAAEKQRSLQAFKDGKLGVLVCTDSAARGIDIPLIQHVIQADFASSAIDFIHRIGRTARAGNVGKVTSICADEDQLLAAAIKKNISAGLPVEDAFSRKRSFRRKYKKYGESRTAPSVDYAKAEQKQPGHEKHNDHNKEVDQDRISPSIKSGIRNVNCQSDVHLRVVSSTHPT